MKLQHPVFKATSLAAALAFANQSHALMLGHIESSSKLGQPLQARIPLSNLNDTLPSELRIQLASNSEYQRLNVLRQRSHQELEFKLHTVGNETFVSIKSEQPIKEPIFNFVVSVHWPQGHFAREYTLLMDPPIEATPVSQATRATTQQNRQPSRKVYNTPVTASGETYTTRPGDSLWKLAKKLRPTPNYSMARAMDSIYRLNPQAFIQGNRNKLRTYTPIEVPAWPTGSTRQQLSNTIQPPTQKAASLEKSPAPKPIADPTQGITAAPTELASAKPQGTVIQQVLPKQSAAALIQQLEEVNKRVAELQFTVQQSQQQIITLNQRLAALTLANEALRSAAKNPPAIASDTPARDLQIKAGPLTAVDAVQKSTAPIETPQLASSDTPPSNDTKSSKPGSSWTSYLLYFGLVLVLLGSVMWWKRRRDEESQSEKTFIPSRPSKHDAINTGEAPAQTDTAPFHPSVISPSVPNAEHMQRAPEAEQGNADFIEPKLDLDALETVEPDWLTPPETLPAGAPDDELALDNTQSQDPLMDANIYMAYGRLDDAEQLLRTSIESEPDRMDLRLLLLDVYQQQGNNEAFEAVAAQIEPQASHANQQKIEQLRTALSQRPAAN